MKRLPLHLTLVFCLLSSLVFGKGMPAETKEMSADVVIYGGSASGVIAAVRAARAGKSVILIEPGKNIGGLSAGGLGMTDMGNKFTIGGMSREFYERIYREYKKPENWPHEKRQGYMDFLPNWWKMGKGSVDEQKIQFTFEPHIAERVFNDMVREAGVRLIYGERLDLDKGVVMEGKRIKKIRMESGREFSAKIFVDTTYEGDLMVKAGVSYTTGREGNAKYGETLNGMFATPPLPFPEISPYVVPGDPSSGLLPQVEPRTPGKKGDADHRQQAYNFRVCLTNVPENRVPIEKPADYNPIQYEAMARWIKSLQDKGANMSPVESRRGLVALRGKDKELGISFHRMPNWKTDSNIGSEFGSDFIGMSWDWADGDYALREKRWQQHKTYVLGLLWFLGNDERVPAPVREEMQKWGLAKDEFVDNGHWPFQLYVREARRMVSDYVMTEHDARGNKKAEDPVAMASYDSDSHGVTYFVDDNGILNRERGFYVKTGTFPVSYRSIRPKAEECENLLVPMCLSSSHAAYGPMRMEPVFMMLGHAAGLAASMTIDEGCTVQELPYKKLRKQLLEDGMVLEWKKK